MVFVPLFDIILAGVADHEVGSASGILQALQQLGMSLGVAGLGTLFFGLLGSHVDRAADFMAASEPTILVTVGLLAAALIASCSCGTRGRTSRLPWPRRGQTPLTWGIAPPCPESQS